MSKREAIEFAVIGAGPAGLAAAYELSRQGRQCLVLEQTESVGGLSRTCEYKGYRFDIGGHRFFTKNSAIRQLWHEVLPEDLLTRPRMSRIYYGGKFFKYPLSPMNALVSLGPVSGARAIASFAWRRLFPTRPELSFEDWVTNRFGRHLFLAFFKSYTEKVWGIPSRDISADWAAQRIRNLDLKRAILNAFSVRHGSAVTSLIDSFEYPRFGPGQMYDALAARCEQRGVEIVRHCEVVGLRIDSGRVSALHVLNRGRREEVPVQNVISSMPITDLALRLSPGPPSSVVDSARALRYRAILTVNLILRCPTVFPDTWIYLHAPEVQAGRLQIYKNWSPEMVPDPRMSGIGFEYFCWEDDDFWKQSQESLAVTASADLARIHQGTEDLLENVFVARYGKAYPVYEGDYRHHLDRIRSHVENIANLVCVGRYGQFRYNNMDHSMLSAILGARRLLGEDVDPWAVNADAEYQEEIATRRE